MSLPPITGASPFYRVALLAAGAMLLTRLVPALSSPLEFDDSFMFYRYALQWREGLGFSWNPDGVPTYGMTSLIWGAIVLAFSYLPFRPEQILVLASGVAGAGALLLLWWKGPRPGEPAGYILSATLLVLLPAFPPFAYQVTTGMDTMASFGLLLALGLAVSAWLERPTHALAVVIGVTGVLALLTRPENGLAVVVLPTIAWSARLSRTDWRALGAMGGVPLCLWSASLLFCHFYFGTALPLSFYAKSGLTYEGFTNPESSLAYLLSLLPLFVPLLAIVALGWRREDALRQVAFLLPWLMAIGYLLTVRQVMGFHGRFYVPWIALLIPPAIFAATHALTRLRKMRAAALIPSLASIGMAAFLLPGLVREPVMQWHFATLHPVEVPEWKVGSTAPLPEASWGMVIRALGDEVIAKLPAGATIAATEVGYLGAANAKVTLIDFAGLNDTGIGLSGFDAGDLLARRRPDLIWFPHDNYSGLRARLFSEPALVQEYDVYPVGFLYGVAIRRSSPHYPRVERLVSNAWAGLYGPVPMSRYKALR